MKLLFIKYINRISINKKLFYLTVIGAVMPIGLLLVFVFSQISYEYETRREITINSIVETISFDVNSSLFDVQNTIQVYIKDDYLMALIEDTTKNVSLQEQVESKIDWDIFSDPLTQEIVIYYDNGFDYNSKFLKSLEDIKEEQWYIDIVDQRYSLNVFRDENNIVLTKSLNGRDYHANSIIKVTLDPLQLEKIIKNELMSQLGAQAYITDPYGNVVMSSKATDISSFNNLQAPNRMVVSKRIGDDYFFNDWQLHIVVDDEVLSYNFWGKIIAIIGFISIIVFILVILNYNVSKTISKRLKLLNDTMIVNDDGILLEITEDMGTDEIGQTAQGFNEMIRKIKQLIRELQTEKSRTDSLLIDKTKAYNEINHNYEQIREQSNQINSLVYVDTLTGLKNRLAITEHIESMVYLKSEIGVMFLDVDNFKFINDTYGHDLGDQVIKATADILSCYDCTNIEIGRFGGDEFLIAIVGCNKETIMQHANSIQQLFLNPVIVDDKRFYLTVSIGVSVFPDHGLDHIELIKKSDLALYDAKDSGRNIAKLYYSSLGEDLEERIAFQNAIKEAFAKGEFYLNYQPYYDTSKMSVIGFEALIRWHSDIYGQVNPFKLITQAEAMGLIIDLGEWIIEEACSFAGKVNSQSKEKISVSINISMIQLLSHDFYENLISITEKIGISPSLIVLEMTETILIDSIESGVTIIGKLREAGFAIALDDFGTGYSSLSYLKRLPVNILKIDKSFVDNISEDKLDENFVRTIIDIAHNRNLSVVAEGVESQEQLDVLKKISCDVIQGYYMNRPMNEELALHL